MNTTVYEMNFSTGKLEPIDNSKKKNLEVGRVLRLNGYSNPEYVIVGTLTEHDQYPVIQREDYSMSREDLYSLAFLADKKDNRIQTYITDEVADPFEVADLIRRAQEKAKKDIEVREAAQKESDGLEKIGREIAERKIPAGAKALIIAERREDESDPMTDYFSSRGMETVVIGYSMHTRDIFSELRKCAGKIPETKNMVENGVEHREKYSMGHGYYLSESQYGYNSNGWIIQKQRKYSDWGRDIYISLAKRDVL